ncbi:MAG: toll/interleukin-1 receptor domain-containing protein [Candidatus Thorarchaeota archaeon]
MRRVYQIILSIIFSIFLSQMEILSDVFLLYEVIERDWGFFFYSFLILFTGYFYIFLFIFLSYELEHDPRDFDQIISLKVLGYLLLAIHLLFFFLVKTTIQLVNPLILGIFELISLYVSFAVMPAIFITLFVFGVNNERKYGNYATSFAILYLIYFIITLLHHFYISPELVPGADRTLIIGTTFSTLQVLLVYLAAGYLFFFGIRTKLPQFILISISWAYYSIYRQVSDLVSTVGAYANEYVFMLVIIIICFLGILVSIRFFELGKRLKRGLKVFISHAVEDFDSYRISDIADYLRIQKKIGHVYFCEADLTGNIDKWMKKTVQKSQILVFISTHNSLASKDSIYELNLARKRKLHIIPILGVEMQWADLKELDLHREFGSIFRSMEFEKFCDELYQQIIKFRKDRKLEMIEEKK